ncbi:class I SAM-dependent methyltransferase [Ohessyouella blattaphilus]|uniref:SAM-dependent methyltransferase n=1 Tax=Ohessyouella blattaphilus TaxID=2949333 RepID=A0ABT1EIG3_9FIRM|nr:SAM-dependent methyltransferase [Ohessyouella blattaphilus]MCP1110473.1 SAM-dependent methyltransferase [Ohessyouella blattaphilus]MCR8563867.1 SAM-dependent methyltransferase [Ohessyouella blattaphilus]MDL2250368.1 SAM-dependent methyltransferase [Lachnospiraceae bacterium OttesenSCG-928-J05]
MNEQIQLLTETLDENLVEMIFSNPRRSEEEIKKIKVRPLIIREALLFQIESFRGNQVFHENLERTEAIENLTLKSEVFRQVQITTTTAFISVLISKKGKVTIKRKAQESAPAITSHNRQKRYLLPEGVPVPFLVDLGVMTKEGQVVKSHFHKYRQINRFLEFIEDILPELVRKDNQPIRIIDFGCGKSYLTFAMYYFLKIMNGYEVEMTGLDLKQDVIKHCNELAKKYGYDQLSFSIGDIKDYQEAESVDLVVSLHACDKATDYALEKAVNWQARVILSVPCCQHELNEQIKNETLAPILKYGLLKERLAALVTDGLRAEYLESVGYKCQLLEFIDLEHTPKNILIRAIRNGKKKSRAPLKELEQFLNTDSTIGNLI